METNNNINIAALLKDCPKGTKLYSLLCGECELVRASKDIIEIKFHSDRDFEGREGSYEVHTFLTLDGLYRDVCDTRKGECLLFPSKEIRDWGCFKVKYAKETEKNEDPQDHESLRWFLLGQGGKIQEGVIGLSFTAGKGYVYYIDRINGYIRQVHEDSAIGKYILSTGTELKLEEEQPKFKVGDVVHLAYDETYPLFVITKIDDEEYCAVTDGKRTFPNVHYTTDCTLATPEEIKQWNKEVLQPNHLHYSKSKRKIIDWFLLKDDVVVRDTFIEDSEWRLCTFSHYNKKTGMYCASGSHWEQCLPYNEKTAKLIGTMDEYKE